MRVSLGQDDKKLELDGSVRLLDSLARELKLSLAFIAKQAEYQAFKSNVELVDIEKSASDSLRLIDSYLLCARTEYGQQLLPLEPVGPGSILYEAMQNIQSMSVAKNRNISIQIDYDDPVMANKRAVVAVVYSLAKIIINSSSSAKDILLVAHKNSRGAPSIGAFSKGFKMKPSEFKRYIKLLGKSDMAMSNQAFTSGVDLSIADHLCASMGGQLSPVKYKSKGGIAMGLLKSDQLSLVEG